MNNKKYKLFSGMVLALLLAGVSHAYASDWKKYANVCITKITSFPKISEKQMKKYMKRAIRNKDVIDIIENVPEDDLSFEQKFKISQIIFKNVMVEQVHRLDLHDDTGWHVVDAWQGTHGLLDNDTLSGKSSAAFVRYINDKMKEGWQPLGGLSNRTSNISGIPVFTSAENERCQSIVKE